MSANKKGGTVKIADDVIAIIATAAATDTDGVHSMSSSIAGDFLEKISGKNYFKGVEINMDEECVDISVALILDNGKKISDIALDTQKNIKTAVEKMTGLKVNEVNISIEGIEQEKKDKAE